MALNESNRAPTLFGPNNHPKGGSTHTKTGAVIIVNSRALDTPRMLMMLPMRMLTMMTVAATAVAAAATQCCGSDTQLRQACKLKPPRHPHWGL